MDLIRAAQSNLNTSLYSVAQFASIYVNSHKDSASAPIDYAAFLPFRLSSLSDVPSSVKAAMRDNLPGYPEGMSWVSALEASGDWVSIASG